MQSSPFHREARNQSSSQEATTQEKLLGPQAQLTVTVQYILSISPVRSKEKPGTSSGPRKLRRRRSYGDRRQSLQRQSHTYFLPRSQSLAIPLERRRRRKRSYGPYQQHSLTFKTVLLAFVLIPEEDRRRVTVDLSTTYLKVDSQHTLTDHMTLYKGR